MDVGVKILLDFVEGRLSAAAFEKEVYENPDVERVLSNDPNLSSTNYVGRNVYLWLLERNYSDPGNQLSIQGAVAEFLERNGIEEEVGWELKNQKLSGDARGEPGRSAFRLKFLPCREA